MGKNWSKVIDFSQGSLNTAFDPADIAENELVQADHANFENKVLEVAPGRTLVTGSPLESGAQIDGQWRSYNKDGDKCLLVACNGKIIYKTDAGAFTDATLPTLPNAATALTKNVRYSFLNDNDKTLITNGYDPQLSFDPKTKLLKLLGMEPPRFYKKIAYFESDEDTLITGDGHSHDTVVYRNDERTGDTKQSLKITAGAGATKNVYLAYATAQDFSLFANGKSIANDDYVVVWIYHRERDYISAISIDFYTSSGNYYRVSVALSELDPINIRDNQWTGLKIKKARFSPTTTGSLNWNSIARVYFNVTSITGEVQINFDNMYWANSPIEPVRFKKVIDNGPNLNSFEEETATWTISGCSIQDELTIKKEGTKSLKVTTTGALASIKKTVALDLTTYIDGVTSQTSDEIHLWVYINNSNYLTSITMILAETSGAKYFSKALTVAGGDFNKGTSGGWTEIGIMKKDFTNTGTASWAAITEIELQVVKDTTNTSVYFDDWCLQESSKTKELSTMELGETDAWTFPVSTNGSGKFDDNKKFISTGDYSIALTAKPKQSYYSTRVLATPIDLTIFGTGETSGNDDIIGFWLFWDRFSSIRSIELIIDVSATGDFATDYYKYEVTPIELQTSLNEANTKAGTMGNRSTNLEIKKSSFTRVGVTGGQDWSTVKGYKFTVNSVTTGNVYKVTVHFDHLHMRRRRGITGIYQWCCLFENSAGEPSGYSEWSTQLAITGTRALLNLVPTSADPDCARRRVFRKGGSLGSDARETVIIEDNTTVQYFDDVSDTLAGQLLTSIKIPTGTIRVPGGAKWCREKFREKGILYRDPLHLDTLYHSNPGYLFSWSELQAIQFDSELLNVFVKDDILYANCKSGMKRIVDNLDELTPSSIQEMGLIKHCIAPDASTPTDELYAFVSFDGVYLFDGYKIICLSEPGEGMGNVRNYFDSNYYNTDEAILFYRKKHLYASVKSLDGVRTLLDCYLPKVSWKVT